MHRGHDHFHPFDIGEPVKAGGTGHNARSTAQWQTPHKPQEARDLPPDEVPEADMDLVEKAFSDAFPTVKDPTSFLRLAGIPFMATMADGTELKLLRVAQENRVDIGALTPHLGGETFRYDPLPAQLVSRRERLAFVYFDGIGTHTLSFDDARALGKR